MKKILLGDSPITSIVGYALAILQAIQPLLQENATPDKIASAAFAALFTALLGRFAADTKKPTPPVA